MRTESSQRTRESSPIPDPGPQTLKWADVELGALTHNLDVIRARVGPSCRVMAVVKADAYGHGVLRVAAHALEAGAWGLGVSTLEEAAALRDLCPPSRILVMGGLTPEQAANAAGLGCAVTCSTLDLARALDAAGSLPRLPVHVKVDTGMGRHGCLPEEAAEIAAVLVRGRHVELAGTMTHFAISEADEEFTRGQFELFRQVLSGLDVDPGIRHACNSAAALRFPDLALDAVRVGLALYGYGDPALRPALSLRSRLIQVKPVPVGGSVGYGRTWIAPVPSVVGLAPIGYADGILRARSNRGWVLVRGRRAPVIGRISMDSLGIDLTDVPGAAVGDVVTLIGQDGEFVSADQAAEWSRTVAYEILTSIGPRVVRRYLE